MILAAHRMCCDDVLVNLDPSVEALLTIYDRYRPSMILIDDHNSHVSFVMQKFLLL
jgi:hypothetical protein